MKKTLVVGVWGAVGGAAIAAGVVFLVRPAPAETSPGPPVTVIVSAGSRGGIAKCSDPALRQSFNDGPCVYYPKEGPPPGLMESLPTCGSLDAGDPVARCVWPGDADGDGQPDG